MFERYKESVEAVDKKRVALAITALAVGGVALRKWYAHRQQERQQSQLLVRDEISRLLDPVLEAALRDDRRGIEWHYPHLMRRLFDESHDDLNILALQNSRLLAQIRSSSQAPIEGSDKTHLEFLSRYIKAGLRQSLTKNLIRNGYGVSVSSLEGHEKDEVFTLMDSQWDGVWGSDTLKNMRHGLVVGDRGGSEDRSSEFGWLVCRHRGEMVGFATYTRVGGGIGDIGEKPDFFTLANKDLDEDSMILVTSVTNSPKQKTPSAQLALFLALRDLGIQTGSDVLAPALSPFAMKMVAKGRGEYGQNWNARDEMEGLTDPWRGLISLVDEGSDLGVVENFITLKVEGGELNRLKKRGFRTTVTAEGVSVAVPAGLMALYDKRNEPIKIGSFEASVLQKPS